MSNDSMGLDEFIGHTTSGGRNNYLKGWKKQGFVECWLHKQASFVALWRHQLPIVRAFEDRDTKAITRRIWSQNWKCWEPENILTDQRKRDKKTGKREAPPMICPVCLLLEDIYQRVHAGKIIAAHAAEAKSAEEQTALREEWKKQRALSIVTPVFKFEVDDPELSESERCVVLTAGGMCDLFKPDKLTDAEKAQLKKAHIRLDEAWKESAIAKCSYVFTVVDNAHPEAGVQIAIEASLLGEKVKQAIVAERKRLGRDDGNPLKNPYPIRWEHHPKEREVQKKYQAFALSTVGANARPLTDAIRELIEGDPPSIENLKRNGNATSLRVQLEHAALVPFDWDALFSQAEKLQASASAAAEGEAAGAAEEDTSFDYGANAAADTMPEWPKSEAAPVPKGEPAKAGPKRVPKGEPAKAKPTVPCDKCGFLMAEDATKCPKCGTEYELVADDAPAAQAESPPYKGGDIMNEADTGQAGDDFPPWMR